MNFALFTFPVYWDVEKNRWFLPKVQVGVKVHCGHKHKDPSDIRLEMKDTISPTDMQIARDAFDRATLTSPRPRGCWKLGLAKHRVGNKYIR